MSLLCGKLKECVLCCAYWIVEHFSKYPLGMIWYWYRASSYRTRDEFSIKKLMNCGSLWNTNCAVLSVSFFVKKFWPQYPSSQHVNPRSLSLLAHIIRYLRGSALSWMWHGDVNYVSLCPLLVKCSSGGYFVGPQYPGGAGPQLPCLPQ